MKHVYVLLFCVAITFIQLKSAAQVSGTVFKDFNTNGTKDNTATYNEPFVAGVIVTVTLINNIQFKDTTDANGLFSFTSSQIPVSTAAKLDFDEGVGNYTAFGGTNNNSNIQFVTAPNTTVSFAISSPFDYWNNITNPDPKLVLVQAPRGTYNGYNGTRFSILQLNNSTNGPNPATTAFGLTIDTAKRPAKLNQTGSIYGLAYQQKQERFFVTSALRRTIGFGINGPGGVYLLSKSSGNFVFGGGFNLQGVVPQNSSIALNFGSVNRVTTTATDDNYISSTATSLSKSRDIDAFAKVATMSFGGIDADAVTDSIYTLNLFQKRLIVLDGRKLTSQYAAALPSYLSTITNAYDITTLPGYPNAVGVGNNTRPYAIKMYKGKGYIGVISDAITTQNIDDLKGYILSFNPNNITAGFITEVAINFNLYRGEALRVFKPWVNTWLQAGGTATTNPKFCSQPIIADIEFNEDGSMDIGLRDRWGDQNAVDYDAYPGSTNAGLSIEQGDVLHACLVGNNWEIEGTNTSCTQLVAEGNPRLAPFNPTGYGNSYNNTGKEFYADVSGDNENESSEGTLAKLMGSQNIVTSCYDPIADGVEPSGNYWYTQGLHWMSNVTGKKTQMARTAFLNSMQVSKTNGLGDIEFVTEPQPIQIGNLVWNDANGNGLQEAGDSGIPNVNVTLRNPGIDGLYNTADDQLFTTTTNANGHYFFDNSNVTISDTRKPSNWSAVNGILPGYPYRVEIDTAQLAFAGFIVSPTNIGSNEKIDNDGVKNGNLLLADVVTTYNTHQVDFGFKNLTAISGYVWNDQNSNGIQNAAEPGVKNVVANLYNALNVLVGTAITDSTGRYTLTNVPAGSGLYVIFTNLPVGGSFTNTLVGGVGANDNSDADNTGRTAVINIAPGQKINGIDAGIKGLNVVLPVSLISFKAEKRGKKVLLEWKAVEIIDVQQYQIQHSIDGIHFYTISNIAATGASTVNTYSFIDESIQWGHHYYRLKIINRNTATQYSAIKLIDFGQTENIAVYPNPANTTMAIVLAKNWINKPINIVFYTLAGVEVLHKTILQQSEKIIVPTTSIPAGNYVLKLLQNNETPIFKNIQIIH
jgi:SdrD B-like domain